MSFEKTFCSSPWLNMQITSSGEYFPCRWMSMSPRSKDQTASFGSLKEHVFDQNIKNVDPITFFQKNMNPVRSKLLTGQKLEPCTDCYIMESHDKVSGRQRQLLKVGIQEQYFAKSLASSTLSEEFKYSYNNHGATNRLPVDWQIDLGNYCNGSCIYCTPENSSSLATEFKKIGFIESLPGAPWCDDPELLKIFLESLIKTPDLKYLHFLGGETLITPGFKTILEALVEAEIAKNITIGFTTNLTVWSDHINLLLKEFKQVNLGMSIDTLTKVNDYVRYPSQQLRTKELLNKWVELSKQHNWLIQIRNTPTCLTVHELDTIYEYAWQNNITVESCNFISNPKFLRTNVLPVEYRQKVIHTLSNWIQEHPAPLSNKILNTRDPNVTRSQCVQDAQSYVNYLKSSEDESYRLPDLITYLKKLEAYRHNSILDYLPNYEQLFRSAGY